MWNFVHYATISTKFTSFSTLTSLISLDSLIRPERWITVDSFRADAALFRRQCPCQYQSGQGSSPLLSAEAPFRRLGSSQRRTERGR